jgi:hypothetical protein
MSKVQQQAESLDPWCTAVYYTVQPQKVVLLQGLFEQYEGIGTVRTLNAAEATVVIMTTPDALATVREVMASVVVDIPNSESACPDEYRSWCSDFEHRV